MIGFQTKMACCYTWIALLAIGIAVSLSTAQPGQAQEKKASQSSPWRQFIESDFPFFSTTLDASFASDKGTEENLVPRAIVFPLSDDCFLAYDLDLLRVVAVWTAEDSPLVNANLAVNSYPYRLNKVKPGTSHLPRPNGDLWFHNGVYAGVGMGAPKILDPRPDLPEEERIVRGGIDPKTARFLGISVSRGTEIEYEVGGVHIAEQFSVARNELTRHFRVSPHQEPIYFVLARASNEVRFRCHGGVIKSIDEHIVCFLEPSDQTQKVSVACAPVERARIRPPVQASETTPATPTAKRWTEAVRLPLPESSQPNALNLEEIPLPLENPYGRAVRPADVNFFNSGRAALVTVDGDVWLCDGLQPGSHEVVWRRFTSGLHEPLSIRIRDGEIFVFDRSGLWRLLDRNNDGEADYHELFCYQIHQSAETREFPLSLELQRDGGFLVSKPGQEGIYSGVLRISPDGSDVTLIASGFRQPYLGYDSVTEQIVATDQQGNWVPSSPVHLIKQGGFYGFRRSDTLDDLPVTPPLTWIPHAECGSATTVAWMRNAKMGPLNDKPILLCYQPPRLMQIHMDIDDSAAQGGVTPLDLDIGSKPIMKAAINPADGLLYLTGFKIWGTSAEDVVFFGRVRANPSLPWSIPSTARIERRGILLQFEKPLRPESASRREAYTVRRWNYQRTSSYGSGHYKLDGSPGTETLGVSSAKLSSDRRSVFLGIRDMREVMQIEVGYDVEFEDKSPFRRQTFLTANTLKDIDLVELGFPDNEVDLSVPPQPAKSAQRTEPTVERGAALYTQVGCMGCHSVDGSLAGKNGPSWLGLYGSKRKLTKTGELVTADDAYLRESILNPSAKIAEGSINGEAGMPVYAGVLRDDQVDSLLMFIKALTDKEASTLLMQQRMAAAGGRAWKIDDFRDELRSPLRGRSFEQGKMVFLGASCFSCHQIGGGKGGTLGPDLSTLDKKVHGIELLRHILEPSQKIEDKYKSRTILTLDGSVHNGFIVFEDDKEIRIASDPLSNQPPIVIPKSEIEREKLSDLSPMPAGTLNSFDQIQILDLLAYIESRGNADHAVFNDAPQQEKE